MTTDRRALGVLLFGAVVIGFAPILVRLSETGPAAAAAWRFAFALPLLAVMNAGEGGPGRPSRAALLAGVFIAVDLAFWHYGIRYTSVANATVLSNMTPIVVVLAGWLLFGERPRPAFVAAMLMGVGGAVVMAMGANGGRGTNPPLGDLFSAFTAVWYAAYFVAVHQARRTLAAKRVMLWSTLAGLPVLAIAALALGERLTPASAAGWAACAALGLMHVAGQGSIAWALGRLPAAVAAVVVLVQPVVAAALGWLLFGEQVTPLQALGAAVALVGVVLAQLAARPATNPVASD